MSNQENSTDFNSILEGSLKDLLDKILNYFEKFVVSEEDLESLHNKLADYENYENLLELVVIAKDVFTSLTEKVDEKLQSSSGGDEYNELEKVLQHHENEIRNNIRIVQHLKIAGESMQAKLEECEKSRIEALDQNHQMMAMMDNYKKDNKKLSESLKLKNEENQMLNLAVRSLEEIKKDYESKLQGLLSANDRTNNFEKKKREANSLIIPRDLSQGAKGSPANIKKLDLDPEYNKNAHLKTDSERKSVSSLGTGQYISLKLMKKTLTNVTNTPATAMETTADSSLASGTNRRKEPMRAKVELVESKQIKEVDNLKINYQKFYNPGKVTLSREKEREREKQSNSMTKFREVKAVHRIPLINNTSNSSSHLQAPPNLSQRDIMSSKLIQRSSSNGIGTRSRSGASFIRMTENS